ncbi:FG-GAPprotein [Angomonas deanei]|nr:FG-GAPprotein [Angomonas deanei]|eukprot:EPY30510.1 FG-GAPprotein [Angomonas deanei]
MLRGASGEDYPGFPFVHPNFKSYSNPQPIDVDGDGTVEWLVATYTGELLVFGAEGRVRGLYRIPPLAMKKNWWESKDKEVENLARTKLKGSVETKEFMSDILKARGVKDLVLREDRDNEKETPPPRRAVRSENTNGAAGPDAYLSKEAFDSLKLLFNPDLFKNKFEFDDDDERFHYRELRGRQEVDVQIDEIAVDPHIMSTPVLVDIDNNGDVDAVIHVTYFFEDEDVPNPQVDPTTLDHYLATAVVCLNLVTGEVRWVRVLGISKKSDPYPTYGLSTPLVVDADESKSLEIYVTSTNGRVDRLNSDGSLAKNWPVYMGPITASPAAEDVTGDGTLDICVGDIEGKVACFDQTGKRIWIRHVVGGVTDRVSFGDVNSDQEMEVVFSTSAGFVYAVHGANGSDIAKFPIVTGGSITAPTLVIQLSTMLSKGLHVVVPAHDGNVYFVDAVTGCIETIDIDEPSSTLVLADDLTNSGYINLIVTTVKGGVYVFQTSAPYSNLNTWPSEVKGLNGFTAGSNHVGVFIADAFRKEVNLRGEYFFLPVTVMDQRLSKGSYLVQVFIGSRVRVYRGILSGSMTHRLKVRAPLERMRGLLTVQVTLPNGQVFTDVVAVAFNLHFLETVKYTLVVPFLLMCFGLFFIHKRHEVYMS